MFKQAMVIVALCCCVAGKAQESLLWADADADYKKGVELFQQEKFGAAQEKFRAAVDRVSALNDFGQHELVMNAEYYDAVCSKNLNRPDAETLFLNLVDNNEANAVTRRAYFQFAGYYFDQKKYDKALTWYKKTDANDLSSAERYTYNFQTGYCYFYKKNFTDARQYFAKVKDVHNEFYYPANYYYGYLSYKQGDYDEAMKSFGEIQKSDLYKKVVPYYIAHIYFLQGKYDEVITYTLPMVNDASVQYADEMKHLLGKAYFEKQQYSDALPLLNGYYDAVKKVSKSDLYQIAYCQYKTKNYSDAANTFAQLSVFNDSLAQNSAFLLADCNLKMNDKSKARLAFQEAARIQFDPSITENASFQYAKLSYDLNFHDVAAKSLQDFIGDYPNSSSAEEAKELLGLEFASSDNYRDALEVIRTITTKPASIRAAYQKVAFSRGTELYNSRDFDGALKLFDEALQNPVDPGLQAACYFWKGECYFNQKKFDDAQKMHLQFQELARVHKQFPAPASVLNSDYTLGYCYLKQEDYANALAQFSDVVNGLNATTDATNKKIYADALLRHADCEFVLHNNDAAQQDYSKVINGKLAGVDYALYQKGVLLGLSGDNQNKIDVLQKLNTEYPTSIYRDDALYELGISYLTIPSYQDASASFNQLITKYPSSAYTRKSHLKLALIYFNLGQNTNALDEYKWVLQKFPNTDEGKEALNGVKELFTDAGDYEGYKAFVGALPNVNVSTAMEDSVMYLAAEKKYSQSDCANAMKGFSDYLNTFPNGTFASSAHFYRGECLFRQNDFDEALDDYEFVADQSYSRYSEKALVQAARLNYSEKKNYDKALEYYQKLSANAEFKSDFLEAYKGILYSGFILKKFTEAKTAANNIIALDAATAADVTEAHFYLAKMALEEGNEQKAFDEFSIVAKGNKTITGAESNYQIAEIDFDRGKLDDAEKQCYIVINQTPSFDYWIAKSYLLIARIFEAGKDYFQAKATLQSIIENYKGKDEIVPAAQELLQKVTNEEAEQSKVQQPQQDDNIQLDSIPGNQ